MATPAPSTGSLQLRPGQLPAILGVFAAGFAVWIIPWILGPLAMVLGGIAMYKGERRGLWVIGLAAVCIGLGIVVHALPAETIGT
jgi:hypothetical protein